MKEKRVSDQLVLKGGKIIHNIRIETSGVSFVKDVATKASDQQPQEHQRESYLSPEAVTGRATTETTHKG